MHSSMPSLANGRERFAFPFRNLNLGIWKLAIQDDGIGSPHGLGGRNAKSLGLRIVTILAAQLEGSFEQTRCPGTRFVLRFPTDSLTPRSKSM